MAHILSKYQFVKPDIKTFQNKIVKFQFEPFHSFIPKASDMHEYQTYIWLTP